MELNHPQWALILSDIESLKQEGVSGKVGLSEEVIGLLKVSRKID